MMILVREALAPFGRPVVSKVYGWAPGDRGRGWTLCERLPGVPISEKFDSLAKEAKSEALSQIAQIFKLIQHYRLPDSIEGYGGLGFDQDGNIVTGPTSIPGGGPCMRHSDLYVKYLQTQIDLSKKCGIVQGWSSTDIPDRIERVRERLAKTAEWEKTLRPTLVHADFDTHNMLFDPETGYITGHTDHDLGHIGSLADECFYSICTLRHLVVPVPKYESNENQHILASSLPNCFDHDALAGRPNKPVNWELALMVDEELEKAGVQRPQDILAMEELSLRYWFINHLSPPYYHTNGCREAQQSRRER